MERQDMEYIVHVTSAPSAAPKRRYPVARMHASRESKAENAKKRDAVQARSQRHPQNSIVGGSLPLGDPDWTVQDMSGHCAPFNDNANWIYDPFTQKAYMIGGTRPADKSETPTSDFYCYDTKSMKWEDLTNSFKFRQPDDRYSATNLKAAFKPLPPLGRSGCTLWRHGETSLLFVFGGCDKKGRGTSKVIIINLMKGSQEWWYESLGEDVNPRISPSVVAIDSRVYVFGGYRDTEGGPQACNSYSIAELRHEAPGVPSSWRWEARDVPYSGQIPGDFVVGQAVSVYDGKKILLAPGCGNNTDLIQITKENLFYFRTDTRSFQMIYEPEGNSFPQDVRWYSMFKLRQPPANGNQLLPVSSASSRTRGRPRKIPIAPPSQVVPRTSINPARPTDSVIICAWESSGPGYLPEIYHLSLTPEDKIECLNINKRVCDLDNEFQGFMAVDGRMHLLGSTAGSTKAGATWNIYLDIPTTIF